MNEWTKHSTSRMNTTVTEYMKDLPDGYGLQIFQYRTYVTDNTVCEWAVWESDWLNVSKQGITYDTLNEAKTAAETAAKEAMEER